MPKFVSNPKGGLGRGSLYVKARKSVLARKGECWICAGRCPDFSWDGKLPFDSTIVDKTIPWPNPASASVDHTIPIALLDPDDPRLWRVEFLELAHLKCNSARGDGTRQRKLTVKTSRNWLA